MQMMAPLMMGGGAGGLALAGGLGGPGALLAGSTVLQAAGQIQQAQAAAAAGKAQKKAAYFTAQQQEQQAGQERAIGQRNADEIRRQGRFAASRAQAVAAASGGGAADPTVTRTIGDLAAEAELRAQRAMYGANERAIGLETGAQTSRYGGQVDKQMAGYRRDSSYTQAGATALQGGSTLYERYG